MAIPVKLEAFEGPLDLLLQLIEKNKIDIYDIPIVEITDQYLAYISAMKEEDLDVMSEFLVMACTLLDIKSRMLLPRTRDENGEEEDPRSELVEQLLEYKMFKYRSEELRDREVDADQILYRKPSVPEEVSSYEQPVDLDALLEDVTLEKLNYIFQDVMKKQTEKIDPVRSRFGKIEQEKVTVAEKVSYVTDYAKKHRSFSFRELLQKQNSRGQVITTFLAILELMREGTIRAEQERQNEDIMIQSAVAE